MAVFAVTYTYDNRTDVRMAQRPTHREFLFALADRGILLAAGAYADDQTPGGLLAMRAADEAEVASILDADPYRHAGVISNRDIREWGQLIGPWAG